MAGLFGRTDALLEDHTQLVEIGLELGDPCELHLQGKRDILQLVAQAPNEGKEIAR